MTDLQDAFLNLQEKHDELKENFDAICGIVISQQIAKEAVEPAYNEIIAIVVRNLRLYRGIEQSG